ncbi:MAG: TIGR03668 family PPOX class F420-dependent oxidoreductase [Chloroflexota bacterium]
MNTAPPLLAWQRDLLESARVGCFSTVNAAGEPHTLPICFCWVQGSIYSPLDEKPKRVPPNQLARVRHILARPVASLTVDHYEEDWTRLAWLRLIGEARLEDDAATRAMALVALRIKYQQYRTMALEARPLIVLRPRRISSWRARGPEAGGQKRPS